jgi:hypothetical protein
MHSVSTEIRWSTIPARHSPILEQHHSYPSVYIPPPRLNVPAQGGDAISFSVVTLSRFLYIVYYIRSPKPSLCLLMAVAFFFPLIAAIYNTQQHELEGKAGVQRFHVRMVLRPTTKHGCIQCSCADFPETVTPGLPFRATASLGLLHHLCRSTSLTYVFVNMSASVLKP